MVSGVITAGLKILLLIFTAGTAALANTILKIINYCVTAVKMIQGMINAVIDLKDMIKTIK